MLEPDGLPGIDEDAVGLIDPDGGRITAEYSVGRGPECGRRPAAARCGSPTGSTAQSRASTASATQVVTIAVGGAPAALAFGGGLAVGGGRRRARRSRRSIPGSNKVVAARSTVGNAPRSLPLAEGALWVVSGVDGARPPVDLGRAGPRARSRSARTRPRSPPAPARCGWRARRPGTVTRIDPRSGRVVAGDHRRQRAERAGGGRGRGLGRQPQRRDALAHRPRDERGRRGRSRVGARPDRGRGRRGRGVGGRRRGRHRRPRRPATAACGRAASRPGAARRRSRSPAARCGPPRPRPQAAHRGGTLRVSTCSRDPACPDRLAAPDGYDVGARAMLQSLAYDGLVAYRRVGGAAGATLVGALATRRAGAEPPTGAPTSSRCAAGCATPTAAPVRPEDFRASMERFLRRAPRRKRSRRSTPASSARGGA